MNSTTHFTTNIVRIGSKIKIIVYELGSNTYLCKMFTVVSRTDDLWLILSEISGGPFETWKEFHVEPNSALDVPLTFKPKTIGRHDVSFYLFF